MPTSDDLLIASAVILARFMLPLFIPKFPLPAVIACLILDGVDQTIFQQFTSLQLDWYQSYDKALDIYYLVIAYLSTLRNWRNEWAFKVSRFLIYYRLVGVVLFELLDNRALLLIFPNTFEYFFIFYEAVRSRWNTLRFPDRLWTIAAAAIWIVIKFPQEYWIHIAQRDVTDTISDLGQNQPWVLALIGLVLVAAALAVWFVVIPRLPKPHHGWQFAAEPLPRRADTAEEKRALVALMRRPFDRVVLEKIALVALVSIIFAQILPGYTGTTLYLATGVAIIVTLNSAISYWFATKGWGLDSAVRQFFTLLLVNWAIAVAGNLLIGQSLLGSGPSGFLLLLLTLLITLYDYFRPVYTARFELRGKGGGKVITAHP
jgi:hypothetical protein